MCIGLFLLSFFVGDTSATSGYATYSYGHGPFIHDLCWFTFLNKSIFQYFPLVYKYPENIQKQIIVYITLQQPRSRLKQRDHGRVILGMVRSEQTTVVFAPGVFARIPGYHAQAQWPVGGESEDSTHHCFQLHTGMCWRGTTYQANDGDNCCWAKSCGGFASAFAMALQSQFFGVRA